MKLIVQVKLQPTPTQAATLLETLERANTAANAMSQAAWDTQTFRQFPRHKLVYAPTRATTGLAAQVVVCLEAKVADAYCEQCRFAGLADHIAAENIRWAAVNQLYSTGVVPTAAS